MFNNVRDQLTSQAVAVYSLMVEEMDANGFLDLKACLGANQAVLDSGAGLSDLGSALGELQRASLAFPHPEKAGWVVRLPLRAYELPTELPEPQSD